MDRERERSTARGLRARWSWMSAMLAASAVVLAACSGGSSANDGAVVRMSTPTPTRTVTSTPSPTSTAAALDSEELPSDEFGELPANGDEEPLNVEINDLGTFVDEYGYPASATFATVRIPRFGVEARVSSKYVGSGASVMPSPNGPAEVAYYDMSDWDGLGGAPGAGGNAIFSGHVDYSAYVSYADVRFRGLAVFARLGDTQAGDLIEVDYGGQTLQYEVVWQRQLGASGDTNWAEIWSSDVGADAITLYTCAGDFDFAERSYNQRVVVRAHRVG